MAAAYSAAVGQGSSSASTTQDSPSITVPSGNVCYALVVSSDGSPADPSGVAWDPTGVNEALTKLGATLSYGTYFKASLYRGVGLTAKTGIFRATYSASQGERLVLVWAGTGIDSGTPNGTIATATGTNTTPTASATTTAGQLVLALAAQGITVNTLRTFNSPSGTERVEAATSPDTYDSGAIQDQTASGSSTAPQWTLSGATDGWGIFVVPLNDAAAGTTITPGAGTVTLAGAAPSATNTANQWSTPGAGAVTLTGYAPSVQNGASYTITPAAGAVVLAGAAPSVSASNATTITPGAGSLTITGAAPVLTLTLPAPGAGAIVLTGYAPTVTNGQSYTITPTAGAVVVSGSAPTLTQTANQWVTPAAGAVVLSGSAPAVLNGQSYLVTPAAGSVSLAGAAPSVSATAHQTVTPGAASVVLSGSSPVLTFSDNRVVTPDAGAVVLSGAAPSLSQAGSWNLTPGAGAIQITGYAPVVIGKRPQGAGKSSSKRRRVVIGERVYEVNERDIPALLEAELLDRAPPKTAEVVEGPKPRKRVKKAAQPIKTVEQVQEAVEQIKARIEPDNAWLAQALEAVAYRVLERLQDEEESIMLLVA